MHQHRPPHPSPHTCTQGHVSMHACTYTHMYSTHPHTHKHTHAHMHSQKHTCVPDWSSIRAGGVDKSSGRPICSASARAASASCTGPATGSARVEKSVGMYGLEGGRCRAGRGGALDQAWSSAGEI